MNKHHSVLSERYEDQLAAIEWAREQEKLFEKEDKENYQKIKNELLQSLSKRKKKK